MKDPKDWVILDMPGPDEPVDLGVVTHVCICGSNLWKVRVSFDDYEIATVSTEMYCAWCGAKAVTPTPIDKPES